MKFNHFQYAVIKFSQLKVVRLSASCVMRWNGSAGFQHGKRITGITGPAGGWEFSWRQIEIQVWVAKTKPKPQKQLKIAIWHICEQTLQNAKRNEMQNRAEPTPMQKAKSVASIAALNMQSAQVLIAVCVCFSMYKCACACACVCVCVCGSWANCMLT